MLPLTIDVHAVDHRGDLIAQPITVVLHHAECLIEVSRQHPSLRLIDIHQPLPRQRRLAIVDRLLRLVLLRLSASHRSLRFLRSRRVDDKQARLDRLDQALRNQGHCIALICELNRRICDAAQHRLNALHCLPAAVHHWLDHVVQVDVSNLIHPHRIARAVIR